MKEKFWTFVITKGILTDENLQKKHTHTKRNIVHMYIYIKFITL